MPFTPVPLNSGLDTVTPPLMKQGGSLLSCLNYEMTSEFGYRRIDGIESYDGWVNGDLSNYYRVDVTINDPAVVPTLVPGATLFAVDPTRGITVVIGVILAYTAGVLTYTSVNPDWVMFPATTILDTVTPAVRMTTTSGSVSGIKADSATTFLANTRTYSSLLRAQVTSMSRNVAGMHSYRNNLIVAVDTPIFRYTDTTTVALVQEGGLINYNGTTYKIVEKNVTGSTVLLWVEPYTIGTVGAPNIIHLMNYSNATYGDVTGASAITLLNEPSEWAYFVTLYNPETFATRGQEVLKRSTIIQFSGGTAAAAADFVRGGLVSVGTGAATRVGGYVNNVVLQSGTFAGNDAAGYIEVILDANIAATGNKPWVDTASDIFDITGTVKRADIASSFISKIAGTVRLRASKTRYQAKTYNFYGQDYMTRAYGTTGASRGFWANSYVPPLTRVPPPTGVSSGDTTVRKAWGNIVTNYSDFGLDNPKYVSLHARVELALGFEGGSVILSVPGEPLNYQGVLGAQEVATGDHVTGLVEGVDDSTIIFGKRSIRRLTGIADGLASKTIASNSGAFDYTCLVIGSTPVFTGPAGISTLEQAQTYGDFEGARATYKVSNSLPTALVTDRSDSETGGVAMALVVRSKDQYRLWLRSGRVISVAFTNEGPKIMESNYGSKVNGGTTYPNDIRVPFAWTSELNDSGKEWLFASWDDLLAIRMINVNGVTSAIIPDPKRIYSLDRGWGFDGIRFPHYFDVAHMFQDVGTHNSSVKKIRAYGQSYGIANLNLKAVGIITDFEQPYHTRIQDLSMPRNVTLMTSEQRNVTDIVDSANIGLGIKLGIYGTQLSPTETEPSHTIQVLVCETDEGGKADA